jgi:hypothetical protein
MVRRGGRVVAPEGVEILHRPRRITLQQVVPREQRAHRPAGGAAQGNHLVFL